MMGFVGSKRPQRIEALIGQMVRSEAANLITRCRAEDRNNGFAGFRYGATKAWTNVQAAARSQQQHHINHIPSRNGTELYWIYSPALIFFCLDSSYL